MNEEDFIRHGKQAQQSVLEKVEEKLNTTTHGIGAGMSIAGMVLLLVLAMRTGDSWKVVSFAIYGSFQILLYLSSALTHAFYDMPRTRYVLRILDQAAVYLLIAGTYTPTALIVLRGPLGWTIFGIEWGLAIAGILSKTLVFREKNIISDLFYLPMGWLIVFFAGPLLRSSNGFFFMWLMIGGGLYSIGVLFYMMKKMPLSHVVWHLFVIGGGISFYLAYILHLV